MSVLVIGANGLLGSNVATVGHRRDLDVIGTFHTNEPEIEASVYRLDIRNEGRFEELLEDISPTLVVNCAAMTDVDGCEANEREAQAVNAHAPVVLAEQCATRDIDFVHASTDYVFDGTARSPYSESADPNPIQVYGQTKLDGERAVLANHDDALVVRLSFVYGVHRARQELSGFPAWVQDQIVDEAEVPLFADQWVTPTRAGHAAEAILDLSNRDASGIVNVASRSCVTPFEFGRVLAKNVSDSDGEFLKVGQDTVERQAERPRYTCLDTTRIETLLSRPEPTLREDLKQISTYLSH